MKGRGAMMVPMAQTGHVVTLLVPVVPPDVGWELYDEAATKLWLTPEEAARAGEQAARADHEAALARVAALEAELARRGG